MLVALVRVFVPKRQIVGVVCWGIERVLRLLMNVVSGPSEITRTVLSDPVPNRIVPDAPTGPTVPPFEKEDEGSRMNIGNEDHAAFLESHVSTRSCTKSQHGSRNRIWNWAKGWKQSNRRPCGSLLRVSPVAPGRKQRRFGIALGILFYDDFVVTQ